jgi:hypothetical protein
MTEAEFLAATDPEDVLAALWTAGKVGDRKLRLFAAACSRRVWRLLDDDRSRRAVEVAERFADGAASEDERRAAREAVYWERPAAAAAADTADEEAARAAVDAANHAGWAANPSRAKEREVQVALLRDVLGPLPFREVRVDPAWLAWSGGTVPRLAAAAYEERSLPSGELDRGRLAVLADALEEAGCSDRDILCHLRKQGGVHVRACWAVDLLLGKS